MYDDLLSALALVGLASLGTLAVLEVAEVPMSTPDQLARTVLAPGSRVALRAATAASMPVHDLPRVVVRGVRSRDGDLVARREGTAQLAPRPPNDDDARN